MVRHLSATLVVALVLLGCYAGNLVVAQKGGPPQNPQQSKVPSWPANPHPQDPLPPKVPSWPAYPPQQNPQLPKVPPRPTYPPPQDPQPPKVPSWPAYPPQQNPQPPKVPSWPTYPPPQDPQPPKVPSWPAYPPQQNPQPPKVPSWPTYPPPQDPQPPKVPSWPAYPPQQNPQPPKVPSWPAYPPQQNPQPPKVPSWPAYPPQQNPQPPKVPSWPAYPPPQDPQPPKVPSWQAYPPQQDPQPLKVPPRPTYPPPQNPQHPKVPSWPANPPQQNPQPPKVPSWPANPPQQNPQPPKVPSWPAYPPQQNPQPPKVPSWPANPPQQNPQPPKVPSWPANPPQQHPQPPKVPSWPAYPPQQNPQPPKVPSWPANPPQQNPQPPKVPSWPAYPPQQNPQLPKVPPRPTYRPPQDPQPPKVPSWPPQNPSTQWDAADQQPNNVSLPQQTNMQVPQEPATYPSPAQNCDVAISQRVPCGGPDITAGACNAIHCCSDNNGCYYGKAVTVQCTKDAHFIVVVARDATLPNIDLESIGLLGSGAGCTHVDSNSLFAIYHFPVTGCGSVVMEEPGVIIYENRMTSSYEVGVGPLGSITRDSTYALLFQCRYIGTSVETLNVEVIKGGDPVVPDPGLGPIRVELRLANGKCVTKGCDEVDVAYSSYYVNSDYPVTKVLRDPVFIELRLLGKTDPNLVLTLGRCWTTTTPSPHSMPQWDICVDGCPSQGDRYLSSLIPVGASSGLQFPSHYKRVMFQMFTFVEPNAKTARREQVYIHCSTVVCTPRQGESCQVNCPRRNQRDAPGSTVKKEPRMVATVGPLIMIQAEEGNQGQ
ncbi:unnamed protein product [Lota lota]